MTHTRTRAVGMVLAIALQVSGCGVALDGSPRPLKPDAVPFDLLAPSTSGPPPTAASPSRAAFQVWFVAGERLQPVVRELEAPVTPADILVALIAGTTEGEAAGGLRTALGSDALQARTDGAVATVALPGSFVDVTGNEQILAVAQIVLTLTSLPTVSSVRFTLNGDTVDVPGADGTLRGGAVTRAEYTALALP